MRRLLCAPGIVALAMTLLCAGPASAAEGAPALLEDNLTAESLRRFLDAGGPIGYVLIALSVLMVALIVEHLLSIRRGALMPRRLDERVRQLIGEGRYADAEQECHNRPSFLAYVLSAGLQEVAFGFNSVEKGMEDAASEHAARLFRKIEHLSTIGTLAPMLGLMGTVWGMILAFGEFAQKANPQPAEFAPGISSALVTTLFGLGVAVPAFAAYAIFRNRIDEFVAEASLMAEHAFEPYKHAQKRAARMKPPRTAQAATGQGTRERIAPVVAEREIRG